MGGILSRMGIIKSSRVRNNSRIEPNLPPPTRRSFNKIRNVNQKKKVFLGRTNLLKERISTNNNNVSYSQEGPAQYSQAGPAQAGPAQQQPQTRSLMNKIRGKETNTNNKVLNTNKKENIFSILQKNTTFVLQRHATSCANIINKGFKTGSTSNITFGKSRLVAEIAPDSMLSSIGIDECNQVHDYLTNLGTEITKFDGFDYIFCCSELIRTQQTMFLSYFELIRNNNIKIMILPWLNEEHANDTFGAVNKDNLTISLKETKRRWKQFIEGLIELPLLRKLLDYLRSETSVNSISKRVFIPANKLSDEQIKEKNRLIEKVKLMYGENIEISSKSISLKIKQETEKYNKFLEWDTVFYLPDFIYRNPKDPEATFDKRADLERLYKIKMKESCEIKGKCSYSSEDLLFALPFILYLNNPKIIESKQLKIFMTGHNGSMKKLINLITLRSASIDSRSMIKKGVNKMKGVKTNTGEESPYYSKPCFEKQQMMNAEIIQLEPVELRRIFGGKDNIKKMDILTNDEINEYLGVPTSEIKENFNSCRKFPVGFSQEVISKEMLIKRYLKSNELVFKHIHPFYFFYNSNLGIVYSLIDIVSQKIETSNRKIYKEDYPLRVFFGMTLLQYVGYLMVAKVVVSKMKEKFNVNPKYDYQGLLDKISELDTKIHIHVGDTGNVNSKPNFNNLQMTNASQPQSQKQSNASQPQSQQQPNASQSQPNTSQPKSNASQSQSQELNRIIKKMTNLREEINKNKLSKNSKQFNELRELSNKYITITERKNSFHMLESPLLKGPLLKGGEDTSTAIQYMEKNASVYFPKADQSKSQKYSRTIKEYLFKTLPALEKITDRQEKRKKFVELLHTSLLSTCNIKPEQQNKITDFMKNSFQTGLLEQESQTPTHENKNKGQGMLERVQKLNNTTGKNINKINADYGNLLVSFLIPVPFIPLDKDGNNQLDKIIKHMKNMGGFTLESNGYSKKQDIELIYKDCVRKGYVKELLKTIYPSIDNSVSNYIIGMIYKILITYWSNYNIYYSQTSRFLDSIIIIYFINYGIEYVFNFYKSIYIIFSIIENFYIDFIGLILLKDETKRDYPLEWMNYLFLEVDNFINPESEKFSEEYINSIKNIYTIQEKIRQIKRYYCLFDESYKKYYNTYGLIFFYFALFIPDLIYYISDDNDMNFTIDNRNRLIDIKALSNAYKNKVIYLFGLKDEEIKDKTDKVVKKFLNKFIDHIKNIDIERIKKISDSHKKFKINKLYNDFMEKQIINDNTLYSIKDSNYTDNNSQPVQKNNNSQQVQKNIKKVIELITEPVHFESNEKAIATISGIPAKFEQSLVSSHFFAFEFNLDKIKEVCSQRLMKYSKAGCFQFIKADIKNVMYTVNVLFKSETDIWKYFVEIQISLIKQGFVFANQEVKTLIYISRLFGSSFDSILEVFYQSFPYFMFCFEYVSIIAQEICNILQPCDIINKLDIGLEKMIILYKYLNITNIEVMEYIKKYGIIFLIYALLTPFYICQTELNGKNQTLHKEIIIINKLKAMEKYELVKQVKSVFDDKKIVEFIQKVQEKKNKIFGKVPVAQNKSNSNLNLNKFSNNGNTYNSNKRPDLPNMDKNESNGRNADFIWSVFTIPVQ